MAVQTKQEREAWLRKRQQGIGSSDAAAILGISPWKTILELYLEKIATEIVEDTADHVKGRGTAEEPRIRELFESLQGRKFPAVDIIHNEHSYLRASLDGLASNGDALEIKLSNRRDWEATKNSKAIPPHYMAQVQHILATSGAKRCFYVAYPWTKEAETNLDQVKLAIVEIFPDEEFQAMMLEKEHVFWNSNVIPRIPPVVTPKYKPIFETLPMWGTPTVNRLKSASEDWRRLDAEIRLLEAEKELCRAIMIEAAEKSGGDKLDCYGVRLLKQSRLGTINYGAIPELQGVDCERYRKTPPVEFWKFTVGD